MLAGYIDGFQKVSLHFQRARVRCVRSCVPNKEVLQEKRSCFSQDERPAVQLPVDHTFALCKYKMLN